MSISPRLAKFVMRILALIVCLRVQSVLAGFIYPADLADVVKVAPSIFSIEELSALPTYFEGQNMTAVWNTNFNGTDLFLYTLSDSSDEGSSAQVLIAANLSSVFTSYTWPLDHKTNTAYTTFTLVIQPTWGNDSEFQSVPFNITEPPTSRKDNLGSGAIAGIAVGSSAGAAFLTAGLIWWASAINERRRRASGWLNNRETAVMRVPQDTPVRSSWPLSSSVVTPMPAEVGPKRMRRSELSG